MAVIERYMKFKTDQEWQLFKTDLRPLVNKINNSRGEYNLQLREHYLDVYYRGNALASITPNKNGTYSAEIHEKFLWKDKAKDEPYPVLQQLRSYSSGHWSKTKTGNYERFRISRGDFHRFFQSKHLRAIASNIKKVNAGEEIVLEQVLMTDNPPTPEFFFLDRQVRDHVINTQMDLLALRRSDSGNQRFCFMIIEVKLGRNPELGNKVGKQLNDYLRHVRQHISEYAICYEENYRQKKELGLFDTTKEVPMPETIKINRDPNTVRGLIVVGGYSQLAKVYLQSLRRVYPNIEIFPLRNEIKLS